MKESVFDLLSFHVEALEAKQCHEDIADNFRARPMAVRAGHEAAKSVRVKRDCIFSLDGMSARQHCARWKTWKLLAVIRNVRSTVRSRAQQSEAGVRDFPNNNNFDA